MGEIIDTAIILAGGLGTRLRPLTNDTPKPLLPLHGKPIMQHLMEQLRDHGVSKIILSIGVHADKIKNHFKDGSHLGINLTYSVEKEPLGTGGAIKQAAGGLTHPLFLAWGDNLMDVDFTSVRRAHLANKAEITMVLTPVENVDQFGVAKLRGDKITYFIEKPKPEQAPSNLINAGAFIINPGCLEILPKGVSSMERDGFEKLALQGKISAFIHYGQWFPTDNLERYTVACKEFQSKIDFSNKKIIIADVDETVCESCSIISDEMAEQINEMIRTGYTFVFISGTPVRELQKMVSAKLTKDHHLLGNNGTNYVKYVHDLWEAVYNYQFTAKEKGDIISAFKKLIKKENLVSLTTPEDQLQDRGSQITLSVLGRNAPKNLKAQYDPGGGIRSKFIEFLSQELSSDKYDLKIGGTTSIDVTRKGLDKAWGLKQFLASNGHSFAEVLFIGDKIYPYGNDYEVSKYVDCIAVKNPEDTLVKLRRFFPIISN